MTDPLRISNVIPQADGVGAAGATGYAADAGHVHPPVIAPSGVAFYVDATAGSDDNTGRDWDHAFATIMAAHAACVAGRGDFILVRAGSYVENVVIGKDYVNLIGAIPGGYGRPDVVPASGVPLTVTGQGVTCTHLRLAPTGADAVVQRSNGFHYDDCVFDGDGTVGKAGLRLVGSATDADLTASEGVVAGCLFRGSAIGLAFDSAAVTGSGVGSTDNVIAGNSFRANTLDIAAEKTGAGGDYSVQVTQIGPGNVFADKNKATYIDLTTNADGAAGNQTGAIVGNTFASDTITTTKIKMVGTGFVFAGNASTVGIADGSGLD